MDQSTPNSSPPVYIPGLNPNRSNDDKIRWSNLNGLRLVKSIELKVGDKVVARGRVCKTCGQLGEMEFHHSDEQEYECYNCEMGYTDMLNELRGVKSSYDSLIGNKD